MITKRWLILSAILASFWPGIIYWGEGIFDQIGDEANELTALGLAFSIFPLLLLLIGIRRLRQKTAGTCLLIIAAVVSAFFSSLPAWINFVTLGLGPSSKGDADTLELKTLVGLVLPLILLLLLIRGIGWIVTILVRRFAHRTNGA